MKGLKTLIKLHRKQIDELRKRMAELDRQKSLLEYASRKLAEELVEEMNQAMSLPEMGSFFGNYAERIKQRRIIIGKEIASVNNSIAKLAEEISAGFSELKKYEIAYENLLQEQKKEAARKEQAQMDEIGVDQFRRKEKQSS